LLLGRPVSAYGRSTAWGGSGWGVRLAALDSLLNGNPVGHPAEWVLSLELLELSWSVLVQELVEREEAATHADLDVVLFDLDHNPLGAELVNSLRFTHEHDFEFLAVRVVIDILGELFVCWVVFDGNVDCNAGLQIDDVLVEHVNLALVVLDFELRVFQLLEHVKLGRLRIIEFLFELHDVRRGTLKLFLEFSFGHLDCVVVCFPCAELLLNIILVS